MSTTTKIGLVVELAERFLNESGYAHGPCLGAKVIGTSSSDHWEVEFAYEGVVERSSTTDPASILLRVDLNKELVNPIELM